MKLLLIPLALALTSCGAIKNAATPENFDRALIIYDAGREIFEDFKPIHVEK